MNLSRMTKNIAAVLYGEIPPQAGEDDRDVIDQVTLVKKALLSLDYKPAALSLSLDLKQAAGRLKKIKPRFVFNLVESIRGRGEFIYFAPVLLDSLGIPYTGATTQAVMFTSNKVTAKQLFRIYDIPTPPWCRANQALAGDPGFAPP